MDIPIKFLPDEKGYFDRECPNENCLYTFKIKMSDWKEKFSDGQVHCPMCGYIDTVDRWYTQKQVQAIREAQIAFVKDFAAKEISKSFARLAQSTQNNKYVQITYKSDRSTTFSNNPIGQCEEWETEITCDACGTRYSVIGSAYFCPCCGYNSAVNVFDETMDSIERMLSSLPEMKKMLTNLYDRDKAETMCRSMLENSLGDIVSAFQKFAERIYKSKSTANVKVNDFQIVQKGSQLFADLTGKGYDAWLTKEELARMNLLFQRRHIIEHNGGIVDEKYINQSGDVTYVIGQHLVVHNEDVRELITIIKKLSAGLKSL